MNQPDSILSHEPIVQFVDRRGTVTEVPASVGESIAAVLLRNHIPVCSVIVTVGNFPIPASHQLSLGERATAALIEAYDIGHICQMYSVTEQPERQHSYLKSRLLILPTGDVNIQKQLMTQNEVVQMVEDSVLDTCLEYRLIESDDRILIGLSGGVDSSSLLLALTSQRDRLPRFEVLAATFEDFDSLMSPTFLNARSLADKTGVDHHLIGAHLAEDVFHLNRPVRQILNALMSTPDSHYVMYIDHHTTRRALEVFAHSEGISKIALGLHATDLIAGLLNSYATGHTMGAIPLRALEDVTYIYPLAHVTKLELQLYHLARTGTMAQHASPNPWELHPKDRNFYYYLADFLQEWWPGIDAWLFSSHTWRLKGEPAPRFVKCVNCGASMLQQMPAPSGAEMCDVCNILVRAGYVNV